MPGVEWNKWNDECPDTCWLGMGIGDSIVSSLKVPKIDSDLTLFHTLELKLGLRLRLGWG